MLNVKIALAVLTIPPSNAAEERVFPMRSKNKTVFRPNLDSSKSLDSIMTLLPCYKMHPSVELLKKCKAACSEYNKGHLNSR